MARITVEDCLDNEANRFTLVRLAARRAKQLLEGSPTVTDTRGNRAIVSALREIASGKVRFEMEAQTNQDLDVNIESSKALGELDGSIDVDNNSEKNLNGEKPSVEEDKAVETGTSPTADSVG